VRGRSAAAAAEPTRGIEVHLPPLHPTQAAIWADPARFKVVCCGRQWGKTLLGAATAVGEASQGEDWQWVAPSFPIGEIGWRVITDLSAQIPGVNISGRPIYRITFPTGGSLQLRSADNPDSLRGPTLNGLVMDEAAVANPAAWPILRPTLSVRRGKALFISTPKGLNWFHDLWQMGGVRDGWAHWQVPSKDNPWLPDEDVEEARATMSSLMFSQEYLAEFISTGSGLFQSPWLRRYFERMVGDDHFFMLGEENAIERSSCKVFHTVDLAWSTAEDADFTCISTWAVTPKRHLVLWNVDRGHYEGPDVVRQMDIAVKRFGGYLVAERATRQMNILQEAERMGLPVKEVKADKDKVSRALPATAWVESGRVWFPTAGMAPWWPACEEEMLAFPAGRHDDFVDTLAYAVQEAGRQAARLQTF